MALTDKDYESLLAAIDSAYSASEIDYTTRDERLAALRIERGPVLFVAMGANRDWAEGQTAQEAIDKLFEQGNGDAQLVRTIRLSIEMDPPKVEEQPAVVISADAGEIHDVAAE